MARKPRVVEVLWYDASSSAGNWHHPNNQKDEDFIIKSYGILTANNKRYVRVAQNIDENGFVADLMTIPKGMVKKIRTLTFKSKYGIKKVKTT